MQPMCRFLRRTSIGRAAPILLAMVLPVAASGAIPESANPLEVIQSWDREIKSIVNAKGYEGSPEDKETLKARIRTILDTRKMGELAIEKHWKKVSEKDRAEFLRLFKVLVERASVSDRKVELFRIDGVRYHPVSVNGSRAEVKASIRPKNEQIDVEIVYRLYKQAEGWRIYDLVIDEAGMIDGFRSQFNKIITENSFAELLQRMRKKITDEP